MAHYKIGDDPMDSMYTESVNIDLTKKEEDKINSTPTKNDGVSLDTLSAPTTPKNVKAVPVQAHMSQDVKPFDPTTVIPKKEKVDTGANELFQALDAAVEREKANITERHRELEEKMYEDYIDSQAEGHSDNTAVDKEKIEKKIPKEYITDEDDDLLSSDDDKDEEEVEKSFNIYKNNEEDGKSSYEEHNRKVEKMNEVPKPTKNVSISKTVKDEIEYDEAEMDSDLAEESPEDISARNQKDQEKELNTLIDGLKSAAKETIKPTFNMIDVSKYTIGKKSVKASTVILRDKPEIDTADWVLYNAGHPISVSGLTGPELIKLDPENSNRNRRNTITDIYKIIYDHVIDSKKPEFYEWLKQTYYSDLDHIYFALYMATFGSSNFVSYQCPDCKKVFIKGVKFEDMIEYSSDEVKNKVKSILSEDTNVGIVPYNVDLVPASNKFVFGMRSPSLYSVAIETAGLPDNIMEKYSDLVDTIMYIDSVYTVDSVNMQLVPIAIPSVKDDPVKSTVKKIRTLYDILKRLNSDEYYVLRGYISKLSDKSSEIIYKIPAAKCPDCDGDVAENRDTSASDLLFTRHHLGAFANM